MVIDLRVARRASGLQSYSRRLLASAAVVGLMLGQAAYANPVGGTVSSGKATISAPTSSTVQIDQTTKIVIINWNSFNIAGGETTKFVQPNASSIAVNRIGGSDPSTILGSLLANGKVVLINGNGILFGKGATVNVGSLLATTSDASDADIASGKAKFDKAGNPNAQIINQGDITAASGGMVGLIAPAVSNSGTITAKLGSIQLGASNVFTVDFTGDGLVSFPVDGNVVAAAIGKNGKPVEALIVNDGKISGGTVMLTARAAANLVTNVISMKGEIAATSAHQAGGKIVLDGGQSGDITVAGSLNASGTSGGSISVVSQGATSVSGTVVAKNTSATGKGGSIETSGHTLSIGGAKIDAGQGGSWLLDPYDLTVDATAAVTIDTALDAGTDTTLQTEAGSASGAGVQNASGNGDIIINSAISWSTAAEFTLSAYRDIDINANITASGGGALSLTTGTGTTGDYNIAAGKSISFTGGSGSGASLSINGNAYMLLYSMSNVQAINASSAALQGRYALASSLDAIGTSHWVPIGTDGLGTVSNSSNGFNGVFAGLGHTISNLTVNVGSNSLAGLFGFSNGTIRNIGMVGGAVSGGSGVGELVGDNYGGTITQSYATGSVSGSTFVGGLTGYNGGAISDSYATGAVSGGNGSYYVGGLVGRNDTTISNSYATGAVSGGSGSTDVGGLVGVNYLGGTITQSYTTGAVSGGTYIGGLVGYNVGGSVGGVTVISTISDSYATGAVSGTAEVGGLVGENNVDGTISDSHATGAVICGNNSAAVGGLVGSNGDTISGSYATGAVRGSTDVGGLVGLNYIGAPVGGVTVISKITQSYATGAVSGGTWLGGLVGDNYGTISNAYATGAVSGISGFGPLNNYYVGGLVGINETTGTISNAYASGAVNVVGISSWGVGGLVGANNGGAISDVYATGAVSGENDFEIGGLVGLNETNGTISNAYATGAVSGGSFGYDVGGLVGKNDTGGTITKSYWDVETSGQSTGIGLDNNSQSGHVTGKTTAQLQGAMPSGFSSSVWGRASGLFPYFKWQYSTTPQAISGYAYSDAGVTALSSATISALLNGASLGNASSGANGYYYILVAPGTLTGTQQLLTYVSGGTVKANTYVQSPTGNVTNANLWGGYLRLLTGAGTTSTMYNGLPTALGSYSGSDFLYAGGSLVSGASLDIETSNGSGFAIDSALNLGAGTFILNTAGMIAESGSGKITALTLTGSSYGTVTLNGANAINNLAAFTTGSNYTFSLTDARDLTVSGAVNAGTAGLTLTTTGSGNDIVVNNTLTGSTVKLASAATVGSNSSGKITATTLTGSSHGAVTLNAANTINNLAAFSTGGNYAFSLTDAHDLTVSGAVNTGTAGLTLTTTGSGNGIVVNNTLTGGTVKLASAATILSNSSGKITATTLTGFSHGAATLNAANVITNLGAFTTGGNYAFAFTDALDLTVTGAVNTGSGALTLTTTGNGHDIVVNNTLTGGTVTLASAGVIGSNSSGRIIATTLAGSSHGAVTLNAANAFTNLGAFTTGGNYAFALTDSHDLTVSGAVNAGSGVLTLTTTGSGHDIVVNNTLHGGTVKLASAATISSNSSGKITATTLTGSSHGAVALNAANVITNLGAFATNNGNFALTDAALLTTTGTVNAGTHTITLKTTGATSHSIAIKSHLTTTGSAGVVTLTSAGNVTETTAGAIITHKLNVTAKTGISLTSPSNNITVLGTHTTVSGPNNIHL